MLSASLSALRTGCTPSGEDEGGTGEGTGGEPLGVKGTGDSGAGEDAAPEGTSAAGTSPAACGFPVADAASGAFQGLHPAAAPSSDIPDATNSNLREGTGPLI
ncbi:hypothetical protein [Kitasatospora sp. NPDC089509]|uniref:hypothetical protein n=1 Tax=Kitasatospora sp. NPDC089509 TaxID=3364079 RepID=UPI0037F6AE7D